MLRAFYPCEYVESAFDIDYQKLYELGYRGVIFDIDNTLVPHGADSTPEVDALFARIQALGLVTAVISDNDATRVERFLENIDCPYVCDAAKPRPDGYEKALELLGLPKSQVVCVGDQVFTDVLGANLCGLDTILVKYIGHDEPGPKGKRRDLEQKIIDQYERSGEHRGLSLQQSADDALPQDKALDPSAKVLRSAISMGLAAAESPAAKFARREINFCDISPATYAISERKEIVKRDVQDARGGERFPDTVNPYPLPNLVSSYNSVIVKTGPGIDPVLQENKAVNIELASSTMDGLVIRPGETFSFWRRVGNTTKRKGYKDGRIIVGGELAPGMGGGLCNLGNTIHLLVLHSPMDVTELHTHSDALAPDHGPHKPFATGTSVSFNNIDFRFKNNTDQDVQIRLWCEDGKLFGELRSEREFPWTYELVEEEHRFQKEGEKYFRVSKIYRLVKDRETGEVLRKELILDNHSEVMYDYSLIPADQIREAE